MKKKLIISLLALASLGAGAQNLQKGDYGYLYCHMSGRRKTLQLPFSRHHGGYPQHGSFMRLTEEEYKRLQEWSDSIMRERAARHSGEKK